MADVAKRAERNIRQIMECSICMNGFTDPRMLPCIHTFCFECIKRTVETAEKKPEDQMPCPLCRKEFTIPQEGIVGLQRNFFMKNLMESLLEFKTTMQCSNHHLKLECETKEEPGRMVYVKYCRNHTQKPLDYYCAYCKKIVCVSCFVESHKLHDCKDVTTFDEEIRQLIKTKSWKTSTFMTEVLLIRNNKEKRKADFLKAIVKGEKEIYKRNMDLKNIIDRYTRSLLNDLSVIKNTNLKKMEIQMEEIDRCCAMLSSFEAYCNELTMRGSASDICSSAAQLFGRADELEKYHKAFVGRPHQSVEVTFEAIDLSQVLQKFNKNFVGNIKVSTETKTQFENCAIVVGLNDGLKIRTDVVQVNLHRSNEVTIQEEIPTTMATEAFASVHCNTMYVTGIGVNCNEIWKYSMTSGWKKCASLVQGRRRHSAAFIGEMLYICGGFDESNKSVLDGIEAYSAVDDKCTTVGKLVHCVSSSGNCVPFRDSLYIFGGKDKFNKALNDVQVYNAKQNTCTLLTKSMPRGNYLMRAVLWDASVILVGRYTCFIYSFETETWQERKQLKTDVGHFGLVLENERIFVIGGGISENNKDGKLKWKCRDDVRCVPLQSIFLHTSIEWKIHGKLPKPSVVQVYANMRLLV